MNDSAQMLDLIRLAARAAMRAANRLDMLTRLERFRVNEIGVNEDAVAVTRRIQLIHAITQNDLGEARQLLREDGYAVSATATWEDIERALTGEELRVDVETDRMSAEMEADIDEEAAAAWDSIERALAADMEADAEEEAEMEGDAEEEGRTPDDS